MIKNIIENIYHNLYIIYFYIVNYKFYIKLKKQLLINRIINFYYILYLKINLIFFNQYLILNNNINK